MQFGVGGPLGCDKVCCQWWPHGYLPDRPPLGQDALRDPVVDRTLVHRLHTRHSHPQVDARQAGRHRGAVPHMMRCTSPHPPFL